MIYKTIFSKFTIKKLITLINKYAYRSSDSDELRLKKNLILVISICCSACGLVWSGVYYLFLGFGITTIFPLIFVALVIPSIFISHYRGNYKLLVYVQIISISLVPSLIQWSLGSIYNSGFVLAWCFLSPLGAALFLTEIHAKIWMLLFFLIIGVSVIFVPTFSMDGAKVTENAHVLFYLMNIGAAFSLIFITTIYFLGELKEQKEKVFSLSVSESVNREMHQFFTTVNTPIFGVDLHGTINEWNQATEKITGYSKSEALGSIFLDYIPSSSKEEVKKIVHDALKGKETANYEFQSISKNEKEVIILVNVNTRKNTNKEITGVLGVGQDITELVGYRNKLEMKVNERTFKLNKALKKQKELNELKSRFTSTASHEFRTPLSAINFAAGFIKKYWSKMDQITLEKKIDRIESQVAHMTVLLDDILTVSQGDAGKIDNKPLHINFSDFIYGIIEEVYHSSKKSHEIKLITTEKLKNFTIFIDRKLGRSIFINLLSNAIKFSPNAKRITIEFSTEKKYTVISITDFGIGISKLELKDIFNPFTRGKNIDLIQGTGLGLSIVKDAIKTIRGKVIVNSTLGKGSVFIVKIPKN